MEANVFQFGPFELEPGQQVLRRRGVRLKLPASRFRLLVLLVTRNGSLVSRDEIAECLWTDSQNVDIMSGINTAVNQLRAQLGDDPAAPKYIETVIGAGYRFVADVVEVGAPAKSDASAGLEAQIPAVEESLPPPTETSGSVASRRGGRTRIFVVAAVVFAVATPILFYALRAPRSAHAVPAPDLELTRVAGSGDTRIADISPDGKYVAYVRANGGRESVWIKQLATGRSLQLAEIGEYDCPGLAFSADGNFIYYARKEPLEPSGELFQEPLLGGAPVQVLSGISGAPAISPDGKEVAFVRSTLVTHGEDSLVTAFLDGSGERVLATYKAPGIHLNRVTWTADGKALVFPLMDHLMIQPAEGGTARPLKSTVPWSSIDDVRSLPPGQDLIVVGQVSMIAHPQIFEISLPGGQVRSITHDLSHYTQVRATADGKALVAIQDVILSTIQVVAPGHESEARSLSAENEDYDGVEGLTLAPQGQIIYISESNERLELMEEGADGSSPRRFPGTDVGPPFSDPEASPRGDFAVATEWFENDDASIWRLEMPGGDQKRLTHGKQDLHASITPDGLWVVYGSVVGDQSILKKVSSQGGPEINLTDYNADFPSVSPDGKWIACSHNEEPNQRPGLAIVPIAGGPPEKVLELPETVSLPPLAWTQDSRAVTFVNNINGVGNVWQQPVGGGPATPVTHFTSGRIFNFQWSRDGRLILARGTETIDAVLIKNFRATSR